MGDQPMNHATLGLLIAFATAGCVQTTAVEQVHAGMSREEVAALMGPPNGSINTAGRECQIYTVTKDFWSRVPWNMTDRYYVCYSDTDGRVETFGLST